MTTSPSRPSGQGGGHATAPAIDRTIDADSETLGRSYDAIPYFAHNAAEHAQLEHLRILAALHGLALPETDRCRVLELACGRGGNLISLARQYPHGEFIGVDLSANHVRDATESAHSMGVVNVQFLNLNLMEIPEDFGEFDFILVFGTFSWVPKEVQDRILSICSRHLSADGLAVIHYMVYPAAYRGMALRDIMLFHLESRDDPEQRLEQATSFLGFLARCTANKDQHDYRYLLDGLYRSTFDDPRNFYHEYLNVASKGLYFRDFVAWGKRHGLQFVSEAAPPYDTTVGFPDEAEEALAMVPDIVHREQYRDFLTLRNTRHSILCREGRSIRRRYPPDAIFDFYISSPVSSPAVDGQGTEGDQATFTLGNIGSIRTSHPLSKAALGLLAERWPLGCRWDDLRDLSIESVGAAAAGDIEAGARVVATTLLTGFRHGLVEFRLTAPECVNTISTHPRVSDRVRMQVELDDFRFVTNQRHGNISLDEMGRRLVPLLDGTNSRDRIEQILIEMAKDGTLRISERGEPVQEDDRLRALVARGTERALTNLMRSSLLIG